MADLPTRDDGHDALLLRETNHRCANDLQLVVGLLALQARRADSTATRHALNDAAGRVAVLARSRAGLSRDDQPDLGSALRQVCEALHSQAEPRGILMSLEVAKDVPALSAERVTTLALVVNELATNAIKHAFREGRSGRITIIIHGADGGKVYVTVDDDGLPLPNGATTAGNGMGFGLIGRLITAVGGSFAAPAEGSKIFGIRVPCQSA